MKVLAVMPGKAPEELEIDGSLESMQQIVGGLIQALYPWADPVALVCNDEGKLLGLEPNRLLINEEGEIYDMICGPFFICGCSAGYFSDLTEKQQDTYLKQFYNPELFLTFNDEIYSMPYSPCETTTDKPNT